MASSLQSQLGSPIAFRPEFVKITGDANTALFLSQALYWTEKNGPREGWFYKTGAEWQEEIGLTRREQERARTILLSKGFIEEKRAGEKGKSHFRVVIEAVSAALPACAKRTNSGPVLNAQNVQTEDPCLAETYKHKCAKRTNTNAQNVQTLTLATTTAETTTEREERPPARGLPSAALKFKAEYPHTLNVTDDETLGNVWRRTVHGLPDEARTMRELAAWKLTSQWDDPRYIPAPEAFLTKAKYRQIPEPPKNGTGPPANGPPPAGSRSTVKWGKYDEALNAYVLEE